VFKFSKKSDFASYKVAKRPCTEHICHKRSESKASRPRQRLFVEDSIRCC